MDQPRRKKMLARVGKLLAQANGTSYVAEAETALLLAQKILVEHGLTLAEVEALSAEEQRKLVEQHEVDDMGSRWVEWRLRLLYVIASNFRVKHFVWRKFRSDRRVQCTAHMVGLAEDVVVARDVYQSAAQAAQSLARTYASDLHKLSNYIEDRYGLWDYESATAGQKAAAKRALHVAFIDGFVRGLDATFRAQVKQSQSMALMLVVHPVVVDRYQEIVGKDAKDLGFRSQAQARDDKALRAGYAAGKAFEHTPTGRLGAGVQQIEAGGSH